MKYNGAILWNSITDLIDHSCSFNTFKFHLKQYITHFYYKCIIFRGCYHGYCLCLLSDHIYIFDKINNRVCFSSCYNVFEVINNILNNVSYDCVLSLLYCQYCRLFIIPLLSYLKISNISCI